MVPPAQQFARRTVRAARVIQRRG